MHAAYKLLAVYPTTHHHFVATALLLAALVPASGRAAVAGDTRGDARSESHGFAVNSVQDGAGGIVHGRAHAVGRPALNPVGLPAEDQPAAANESGAAALRRELRPRSDEGGDGRTGAAGGGVPTRGRSAAAPTGGGVATVVPAETSAAVPAESDAAARLPESADFSLVGGITGSDAEHGRPDVALIKARSSGRVVTVREHEDLAEAGITIERIEPQRVVVVSRDGLRQVIVRDAFPSNDTGSGSGGDDRMAASQGGGYAPPPPPMDQYDDGDEPGADFPTNVGMPADGVGWNSPGGPGSDEDVADAYDGPPPGYYGGGPGNGYVNPRSYQGGGGGGGYSPSGGMMGGGNWAGSSGGGPSSRPYAPTTRLQGDD